MPIDVKEKLNKLARAGKIPQKLIQELEAAALWRGNPWEDVRGMLKHKKINPVAYQRKIRQEWERRVKLNARAR